VRLASSRWAQSPVAPKWCVLQAFL